MSDEVFDPRRPPMTEAAIMKRWPEITADMIERYPSLTRTIEPNADGRAVPLILFTRDDWEVEKSQGSGGVIAYRSGPTMATDDSYEVCVIRTRRTRIHARCIGAAERNLETRRHG